MSSTSSPFGQNEWLVEEMYRKFREDPSSVDASWHEFLVDYNPEPPGDAPATVKPPTPAAPAPRRLPRPLHQRRRLRRPHRPPSGNGATNRPGAPAPASPVRPATGRRRRSPGAAGCGRRRREEHVESLDLPTATSVRAIPAKLMIDNRIVINNQLKRTRGGKISFTHLLGLRAGAGAQGFPEHEPALRRGRRQAHLGHAGSHQPRLADRLAGQGRQAHLGGRRHQALRDHEFRTLRHRLRGHRPAGPRRQARPPKTLPA